MLELISYVSDVLNIKTESKYTIADIEDELLGIQDITAYRHYIRDNIDHFDANYKTGFQKFILLTRKYKALELEAEHGLNAGSYAKVIAEKVKQCRNFVEDTPTAFSLVIVDGKKFFKDHELRALQSIGSINLIIELSKSGGLELQIKLRYKQKKELPKPYEQLESRMAGIMQKTIKGIR